MELIDKVALRLHTFERNILKIIYESSPLNVSWEELTESQREKFRKDASQFINDFQDWLKEVKMEVIPEFKDLQDAIVGLTASAQVNHDKKSLLDKIQKEMK